ncbi:unnamed protein product [Gordionus sp. m RMFG-2023]|uniref:mannose-6-phosphate isomerase-like n=1 Tax=Gordionus sp. m RMFG-2023 TaxID=3053472 RepID=UPI0030E40ABB
MVFYLKCVTQNYEWGKKGMRSKVAQLINNFNQSIYPIDDNKCYAELWMGTHNKGPSEILGHKHPNQPPVKVLLSEYIESSPEKILGNSIVNKFGSTNDGKGSLPFLFKVLSINKALSIQAHPNKQLAAQLHKEYPNHYPDNNHKPEIAIALTPFQALCGFRLPTEICQNLRNFPELEKLIGVNECNIFYKAVENMGSDFNDESLKLALKKFFTKFMGSPESKIIETLNNIMSQIPKEDRKSINMNDSSKELVNLILKLHSQFPGDIGCLAVLFFNVIHLEPGEAIFLGPDEPHAYIEGDCIECMACSDNVVRAGLTPKFKDISVLCGMLTYDMGPASSKILKPTPLQSKENNLDLYVKEYRPNVPEFVVQKIEITPQNKHLNDSGKYLYLNLPPVQSASVMIVIEGQANYNLPSSDLLKSFEAPSNNKNSEDLDDLAPIHQLKSGAIIFMNASEPLHLKILLNPKNEATTDSGHIFLAFRAYTPL